MKYKPNKRLDSQQHDVKPTKTVLLTLYGHKNRTQLYNTIGNHVKRFILLFMGMKPNAIKNNILSYIII